MPFTSLRPILYTTALEDTIRFYVDQLGFRHDPQAAAPGSALLSKDAVFLQFSIPDDPDASQAPAFTGALYIYTDDIDKLWEDLLYKASIRYPIHTFSNGMREFGILDNNGYLIRFGQLV